MTKFIAKNNRLTIILKHGIPPEPITGRQGTPTLFVKFNDGISIPTDMAGYTAEEVAEMMRNHPGFKKDFIEDLEGIDPYKNIRREAEPRHSITEMKYGHLEAKVSSPKGVQDMPSEQRDAIVSMAKELAKEMSKTMVKDILREMTESKSKYKEEIDPDPIASKDVEIPNHTGSNVVSFSCSKGCGKISKTKFGIMAHERYCSGKNEKTDMNKAKDSSVIVEKSE